MNFFYFLVSISSSDIIYKFVTSVRHLAYTIENGNSSFCEEYQRKVYIARF